MGLKPQMYYLYAEAPEIAKPILLIAHLVSSSLGCSKFLKLQFIDQENLICPEKQTERIQSRLCGKTRRSTGFFVPHADYSRGGRSKVAPNFVDFFVGCD